MEIGVYFGMLGVSPQASLTDATNAYRELQKVWHPERFAHDDRLKSLAEAKTKELQIAIRAIEKHFNEKNRLHGMYRESSIVLERKKRPLFGAITKLIFPLIWPIILVIKLANMLSFGLLRNRFGLLAVFAITTLLIGIPNFPKLELNTKTISIPKGYRLIEKGKSFLQGKVLSISAADISSALEVKVNQVSDSAECNYNTVAETIGLPVQTNTASVSASCTAAKNTQKFEQVPANSSPSGNFIVSFAHKLGVDKIFKK